MREVTFSKDAARSLGRMPANTSDRIRKKVAQYAADPAGLVNNVSALSGRAELRLRVGDWRVLFRESPETVHVLGIGPRSNIYE